MRAVSWRHSILMTAARLSCAAALVITAACRTVPDPVATLEPGNAYSGYFIWDSERSLGNAALQCMQLVFNSADALPDGRVRLEGVTRYVTGVNDDVDFVEAEMIFDPAAGTFIMWERNATSDSFVSDGKFEGRFHTDMLFLSGVWASDGDGESGSLTLRRGRDAPCLLDRHA